MVVIFFNTIRSLLSYQLTPLYLGIFVVSVECCVFSAIDAFTLFLKCTDLYYTALCHINCMGDVVLTSPPPRVEIGGMDS